VLRDLGSRNGVVDLATGRRVAALAPARDREVRLGRSVLRLRTPDHPVEPALLDSGPNPWLERAASGAAAALWLALVIGVAVWQLWRSTFVELETRAMLEKILPRMLMLVAWAGGWALLGRLLVHASRFAAHLAAACAYWLAWAAFSGSLDYAHFALSPIAPVRDAQFAGEAALLGGLAFLHLSLATGLRRSARVFGSAGVLAATLAIALVNDHGNRAYWVRTLPYWSQLEPVDPAWLPTESPEQFFAHARSLEGELAALAERERVKK